MFKKGDLVRTKVLSAPDENARHHWNLKYGLVIDIRENINSLMPKKEILIKFFKSGSLLWASEASFPRIEKVEKNVKL